VRFSDRDPIELSLGDEVVSVRVRESRRRRSIRIGIGPGRPLEVIVPSGTSDRSVRKVLDSNRDWIHERLRSARVVAAQPSRLGLDTPGVVHLNGATVPVHRRNGRAAARLHDGRLLVGGGDADAAAAIARWYRREAGVRIAGRVDVRRRAIGVSPRAISIRDPRSRWGSCSSTGTLSFSWRLLLAPADILDYVVVHELCHLIQPNHSRAFWDIVETHYPHRKTANAWLHEYGYELHRYDPAAAVRAV
jgi:predicted metal-dependent hydrolase